MANNGNLETFLERAEQFEKNFNWLEAIEIYKDASTEALKGKGPSQAAMLFKNIGHGYERAAYQANTNPEFRARMKKAIEAYEKAVDLESAGAGIDMPEIYHTKAMVAKVRSKLEPDPSKRLKLIMQCLNQENQALEAYEKAGKTLKISETYNNLLEFSREKIWLPTHPNAPSEKEKMVKEILNLGEKTIKLLSKFNDDYQLARAYNATAACYIGYLGHRPKQVERGIPEELTQKCLDYAKKALTHSKKSGDPWLIGGSNVVMGFATNTCSPDKSWIEFFREALKYGEITRDNGAKATANLWIGMYFFGAANYQENPEHRKLVLEKALKTAEDSIRQFHIIDFFLYIMLSYRTKIQSLTQLASLEINLKSKRALLKKAIQSGLEGLECVSKGKSRPDMYILHGLGSAYNHLAMVESRINEKKRLLEEALRYEEASTRTDRSSPFLVFGNYAQRGLILSNLAKLETNKTKKIELLNYAVSSMKDSVKYASMYTDLGFPWIGRFYFWFGRILDQLFKVTGKTSIIEKAIEVSQGAINVFEKAELDTEAAESYWQLAKLHERLGDYLEASSNYESAGEKYIRATQKIPQLKEFYNAYSAYMRSWSCITQARYYHSILEYDKAKENYEKAAELHKQTEQWNYLAPNYFAWARAEEAERLSRKEQTLKAKQTFQKALKQFKKAEEAIRERIERIASEEEKEMNHRLLKASDNRSVYCQTRILVEDAKLLDREGKYLESSKSYGEAAKNISAIIEKMDVEAERKELEYLAILCRAWEKMATGEEATSSEAYLEAAEFFEEAKGYCFSRKASLWALGNSNFCRGLAAGVNYQTRLDLEEHVKAKGYIKNAATNYLKAGYEHASEYAKGTQRLFDAYVFMNQAESEVDPEKRAKQYQMAENVLQIAAGSFLKAEQPEKRAQVQQILTAVREEKTLAISLTDVMHAPTITSTTSSFAAPTPTNEASVGLEHFEHANVQANLIADIKKVKVGEAFCLSIEFVNAGKEPALLTRVENFVPPDFIAIKKPEIYRLEESCLNMKGKQIAPLKMVEAKIVLQPSRKGVYKLKPKVHYLDELGQNRSLQMKSIEIKVEEVILADHISTGTRELDSLLLGGIPEGYAVVLTGSPSDEREMLIKNYLEAGTKKGETSFCVTTEAGGLEPLLESPDFHLFLCNPKPKIAVPDQPNIVKLRSKTDINNLNMALAKASHYIKQGSAVRRACIETVSDVLLRQGSEVTRRWLAELITELTSKGFTLLAVMDPEMHPADQSKAVLNLFDGEISITQIEDTLECKKAVVVRKLRNQDFIKNSICLTNRNKM